MLPQFFDVTELVHNAYYIVMAPLLVATLIILLPFFHKTKGGKTLAAALSIGAVLYGFGHSLMLLQSSLASTTQATFHGLVPEEWTFLNLPHLKFSVGLLIDNLTIMMLLVVTSVSLLVQVYTHGYMREDPGYSRFYAYLSLFTFSMLGLVVSTNLFQMYFFWELVGVCSYFLIGFWNFKESAARACLKAFVVNRIGDCLFLAGLLLLFAATSKYWDGHTILSFADAGGHNLTTVLQQALADHALVYANPLAGWSATNLALIAVLIFVGQWPNQRNSHCMSGCLMRWKVRHQSQR